MVLWEDAASNLVDNVDNLLSRKKNDFLENLKSLTRPSSSVEPTSKWGKGNRNNQLYNTCIAAISNDPDPEPALKKAEKKGKRSWTTS